MRSRFSGGGTGAAAASAAGKVLSDPKSSKDDKAAAASDLTQADLDRWLTEGPTSRRAVRYFLQWARARSLTGDLTVPLPPRSEPVRLLGAYRIARHQRRRNIAPPE
jgi:hypothetical protein